MRFVRVWACLPAMIVVCAIGCASTGGNSVQGPVAEAPTREQLEAKLRAVVDEDLARARKEQGATAEVTFKRPYYYKEFYELPGAEAVYSLDFTEKESRTTPLTAEMEVEKVRYATRLKTDRDAAQKDDNFLRSHGISYVSYELRNGEWRRLGDLFLADKTEESIAGEWQQVKEEKRPTGLVADESTSWFERLKFWK